MLIKYLSLILIFYCLNSAPASGQNALTKADITQYMETFRREKFDVQRKLAADSVFFYASHSKRPEFSYVEFYRLVKNQKPSNPLMIYQFYYVNGKLIFINQATRTRKHFSSYYLNDGRLFESEKDDALTSLTQADIDALHDRLLSHKPKLSQEE